VGVGASIATHLRGTSDPAATTTLQRVRAAATDQPRFPAQTQMNGLSDAQAYEVYASTVKLRGNDAAHDALARQRASHAGLAPGEETYLAAMPPYDFRKLVGALRKAMGYHVVWIAPPGKMGAPTSSPTTIRSALGRRASRCRSSATRIFRAST